METALRTVNALISALFFICYAYQFLYIPLVLAKKQRPLPALPRPTAMLCSSRRGTRLPSLAVFWTVCGSRRMIPRCSRCTWWPTTAPTSTARRRHDAGPAPCVYERFDQASYVGKGYALDYLTSARLKADGPDGYRRLLRLRRGQSAVPQLHRRDRTRPFPMATRSSPATATPRTTATTGSAPATPCGSCGRARYLNGARMPAGQLSCRRQRHTASCSPMSILDKVRRLAFLTCLTEDIQFTVANVVRGEEDRLLRPPPCSTTSSPRTFRQSCRQRLRWARGYHPGVPASTARPLLPGAASAAASRCYDMAMAIMPAFVLTCVSILANVTLAGIGLAEGAGLWFAMRSLLECLGGISV